MKKKNLVHKFAHIFYLLFLYLIKYQIIYNNKTFRKCNSDINIKCNIINIGI